MPRIFDNIEEELLPALRETIAVSDRADFCVGYFNLRGWKALDSYIERWSGGEGHCCRLLVGMQRLPAEELRTAFSLTGRDAEIDNQTALRLKKRLAEEFRDQLAVGAPTNEDEACLRRLASQIKAKKVVVKLFLRHPLHAKLYLLFRPDRINPIVGYLSAMRSNRRINPRIPQLSGLARVLEPVAHRAPLGLIPHDLRQPQCREDIAHPRDVGGTA